MSSFGTRPKNRIDNRAYPIRPHHIDTEKVFYVWSTSSRANAIARAIVGLCRVRDTWGPFGEDELRNFFAAQGIRLTDSDYGMSDLLKWGYIIGDDAGGGLRNYYVTHQFVCKCLEDHASREFPGLLPERP